ncbi:diaminopimelate epimerase [Defluviitalea phaphyphila]|uniref:diaminopimelate epimerase n=1 Tax=Defluviitalea phaphyphila TaxID=1473580 RepID=UPI000730FB92|nr:diaminopimelate epimerase [Defluviitalea phaphyphila]
MELKFTKMQGCGNDYIYFDCTKEELKNPEELAKILSDRHFGIGGDGIVMICKSNVADAKMRMFNADGSEGKMCGNAIRCVGKYLYDNHMVNKDEITIDTLSGIKKLKLYIKDNKVDSARVNMGKAEFDPKKIPVKLEGEKIINKEVNIGNKSYNITCVSMGNPHCVVFMDNIKDIDIKKIGMEFEYSPLFPERVNTEFVKVINENTIEMRVWERGSGETLACGTGACAAAVASVENGFCKKGDDIKVILLGGELIINYTDERVLMTGKATKVFEGVISLEN